MAPGGRQGRGVGQVGLGVIADGVGETGLAEQIVEHALGWIGGCGAMVFGEQAVDVEAAFADLQRSAHDGNLECVRRCG